MLTMETEVGVKDKYNHSTYTDEEIDSLLEYFKCESQELEPFLDSFEY